MTVGMQDLVSGMQVLWHRQEVLANNLANASTPGFKRDDLVILAGRQAPFTSGNAETVSDVPPMLQWTDFSQGEIRSTGRSLDVAIDGRGFLVVQTARGERYTRAGALGINPEGYLITVGGDVVLGEAGPIAVRGGRVTVSPEGQVSDGARTVATLKVVDFPRPYRLQKDGAGLFAPAAASAVPQPAQGHRIVGEALETSNLNPVETMVTMIEVLRKYEALQRTVQAVEEANRQSTGEIGKV